MESNPDSRWVAERLKATEPKWTPNVARGWALLESGRAPRHRTRAWIAATATAALVLALIAIPQGRALAQQIWYRLFLTRVDVVRVDLSRLPFRTEISTNGMQQSVKDVVDAEQKAGFKPRLPDIRAGRPSITVTGPIVATQTIRTGALTTALQNSGASDVHVPAEWDGLQLRATIGPMVIADYPGEIQVLQTNPIKLDTPARFPLDRFAEIAFRSIGVPWWEARAMGRKFAEHPAWLLNVPPDEVANLQEIELPTGRGLLVEDFKDDGTLERVTIIYSTPDRIYLVSSPTRETSIRIASNQQ